MAALSDPTSTPAGQLQTLQNGARARGVELMVFTAGAPDEISPAIDKAKAWGATALNVLSSPLFSFNRRIVMEWAAAQRLPAIYEFPEVAEEGGLTACAIHLGCREPPWSASPIQGNPATPSRQ